MLKGKISISVGISSEDVQ